MSLETEAIKALQDGQIAEALIQGMNWTWLVIAIGLPIFGMILYKYVLLSLADRLILFISNKAWTDEGKLVEFKGEKWTIQKVGLFRVFLAKAANVQNRGKIERMKKTLTITISKYLASDIIYYEYKDLYSEDSVDETAEEIPKVE